MKTTDFSAKITHCSFDELKEEEKALILAAKAASENSYSPYSHFQVGAAMLLDNGQTFTGCNQENVAYPSGLCAERACIFSAGSVLPENKPIMMAVAAQTQGEFTRTPVMPCGACRQVMVEVEARYHSNLRLLLYGTDDIVIFESAQSILPFAFAF